jgi:hypothetical protein
MNKDLHNLVEKYEADRQYYLTANIDAPARQAWRY